MCRKVVEWCRERQRQLDLANLAAIAAEHVERRSLGCCSLKEVRLLGKVAVRALHVRIRRLSHLEGYAFFRIGRPVFSDSTTL